MSELRQRQAWATNDIEPSEASSDSSDDEVEHEHQGDQDDDDDDNDNKRISFLDILRVLVTLVIASCGLSYYMTSSESLTWGYRPWFTRWPVLVRYINGPLQLTPTQLSLHNGTDPNLPIYLAINGTVFDVTANPRIYGPGGMYGFFAGKDAARAFVTGCFDSDGLVSDLTGVEEMFIPVDDEEDEGEKRLSSGQKKVRREQEVRFAKAQVRRQVEGWQNFYRNHRLYFEVGRVVGGKSDGSVTGRKVELCEAAKNNRPKRGERNEE